MAKGTVRHLTLDERRTQGKEAADRTPVTGHRGWTPAPDRPDPVALLEEQSETREPDLVPVRYGRMTVSPFTFYRGAAKIMAADLEDTPTAGFTRAVVWRRASVELRWLRLAGAATCIRLERLRRDIAWPVRVRRLAPCRQFHHCGEKQRLR